MSESIRRVAVTGAAGYIGSHLIQRLEREDVIERVLAIDIRPLSRKHTSKVMFRQRDVTAPMAETLAENDIQAVVHLAFVLDPGRNRAAIQRVNVGGTANVLDACAQAGVQHLLYLSSTTVYGAHPDNPPLLTEESPVRPVKGFQYGEDKARCETLLDQFTQQHSGFTATVLRAPPVMGPNTDNFIAQAFSKPFLVGVKGYDPPMQFLHEEDLTEVMCLSLRGEIGPGVYNVAGDGAIRWSEVDGIFGRKVINLPAPLLYGLTGVTWSLRLQSDSPACGLNFIRYRWTASAEKIKRELGVELRYSSKEAWEAFVRRQEEPVPANEPPG